MYNRSYLAELAGSPLNWGEWSYKHRKVWMVCIMQYSVSISNILKFRISHHRPMEQIVGLLSARYCSHTIYILKDLT